MNHSCRPFQAGFDWKLAATCIVLLGSSCAEKVLPAYLMAFAPPRFSALRFDLAGSKEAVRASIEFAGRRRCHMDVIDAGVSDSLPGSSTLHLGSLSVIQNVS